MTRTIFDIEPDETAEREIFKSAFVDSNAEIACVVRWMLRIGPAKAERLFNAAMEKITSPHEPERGHPPGSTGPQKKKAAELEAVRQEYRRKNSGKEAPNRFIANKLGLKPKSLKRRLRRRVIKTGDK